MILPVLYEKAGNLRVCFILVRLSTSYYELKKMENRVKEALGSIDLKLIERGKILARKTEQTVQKKNYF